MQPQRSLLPISLLCLLTAVTHGADPIILDGQFDDWATVQPVATDDVGDATGAFDLSKVSARLTGSKLFVHFDSGTNLNLPSGPEEQGTLRLLIRLPDESELSINFRGRVAIHRTGNLARWLPWQAIDFAALPTATSDQFEIQMDLAPLGVRTGDEIALQFDGSDSLKDVVQIVSEPRSKEPVAKTSLAKTPGTIRVASMNTLHQGTADETRSESIRKLLEYVQADVYCFNEEWEEDLFREHFRRVLPNPDDAWPDSDVEWNVHWSRSRGIVSRLPLDPVDVQCGNATAAMIRSPTGKQLAVVSVHLRCCGHAGSEQDDARISQVTTLAKDFQSSFAEHATVVLGDFNLVGSRRPLEILQENGLKDVLLRSPIDQSAVTWRAIRDAESFWPGRLDYVTANSAAKVVMGFTLNSGDLTTLKNLDPPLPRASDHALLVVDIQLEN